MDRHRIFVGGASIKWRYIGDKLVWERPVQYPILADLKGAMSVRYVGLEVHLTNYGGIPANLNIKNGRWFYLVGRGKIRYYNTLELKDKLIVGFNNEVDLHIVKQALPEGYYDNTWIQILGNEIE